MINFNNLTVEGFAAFIMAIIFSILSISAFIYFARHKEANKIITSLTTMVFPGLTVFCWTYLLLNIFEYSIPMALLISACTALGFVLFIFILSLIIVGCIKLHHKNLEKKAQSLANQETSNLTEETVVEEVVEETTEETEEVVAEEENAETTEEENEAESEESTEEETSEESTEEVVEEATEETEEVVAEEENSETTEEENEVESEESTEEVVEETTEETEEVVEETTEETEEVVAEEEVVEETTEETPVEEDENSEQGVVFASATKETFMEQLEKLPEEQYALYQEILEYAQAKEGTKTKASKSHQTVKIGRLRLLEFKFSRGRLMSSFMAGSSELKNYSLKEKAVKIKEKPVLIEVDSEESVSVAKNMIDIVYKNILDANEDKKEGIILPTFEDEEE